MGPPEEVQGHQEWFGATKNDHGATKTMPQAQSQPKDPTRRPQGQPKPTQDPPELPWGHQRTSGATKDDHRATKDDHATSPIPAQ